MIIQYCDTCKVAVNRQFTKPNHWQMTDDQDVIFLCNDCVDKVTKFIREELFNKEAPDGEAMLLGAQWRMSDNGDIVNIPPKYAERITEFIRNNLYLDVENYVAPVLDPREDEAEENLDQLLKKLDRGDAPEEENDPSLDPEIDSEELEEEEDD